MPLSDLWSNIDAGEADDSPQQEIKRLRKRVQIASARETLAASRARKEPVNAVPLPSQSFSQRLQKEFFTSDVSRTVVSRRTTSDLDPVAMGGRHQQASRERARCVWSFLKLLCATIENLFQPGKPPVEHVLSTCVADDTSTTLRAPGSDRSVVFTVMNTVQSALVRYAGGSWECLHVPTPVQCLNSSVASAIHSSFTAWMLVSATGPGSQWQRLGCDSSLLATAKWKTCVMIGDALKANAAAWKAESKLLQSHQGDDDAQVLGLRVKCCVHQFGLVRRPAVLSVERYWTTLVRLGHLYEGHSFRRSVASAIMTLLQKDGVFVRTFSCK